MQTPLSDSQVKTERILTASIPADVILSQASSSISSFLLTKISLVIGSKISSAATRPSILFDSFVTNIEV